MLRSALVLFLGLGAVPLVLPSAAQPPFHPHFGKKIECQLPGNVTLTLSHITVTFDRQGEAKMQAGGSWHLGNAHLEVSGDVVIGGVPVAAGRYALKGRKREGGDWELVLDQPGRFTAKISEQGRALQTAFRADAPLREHLSLDVQPGGDKQNTSVFLECHFDTRFARCVVQLPGAVPDAGKEGGEGRQGAAGGKKG